MIDFAIKHFRSHDLDGFFLATNAPGRSAYNRVERRMAPLSRELSGVILPHDHFGSHLDSSGKTTDEELELKNFENAGNVLASIWSNTEIDNYPVIAKYIVPNSAECASIDTTEKWRADHVRQSQYCLQIVRCNNVACCSPWKSQLKHVLPNRFLPNPIPVAHDHHGINTADDSSTFLPLFINLQLNGVIQKFDATKFSIVGMPPYDLFCPSIQDQLRRRCCDSCGIYHASIKSAQAHAKACHPVRANRGDRGVQNISQAQPVQRLRPVRVAARRQREMMVILRDQLNMETAEWRDEDELVVSDELLAINDIHNARRGCHIIEGSIAEWVQRTPWEED